LQPAVDAMDAFVIPLMAQATENLEQLAKAIRWIFSHRLLQTADDRIVPCDIGLKPIH